MTFFIELRRIKLKQPSRLARTCKAGRHALLSDYAIFAVEVRRKLSKTDSRKSLELTLVEVHTLSDMEIFHIHSRTRMCAQAIMLFSQGLTLQQVAAGFAVHFSSVAHWWQRWNKDGLTGLYDAHGGHGRALEAIRRWRLTGIAALLSRIASISSKRSQSRRINASFCSEVRVENAKRVFIKLHYAPESGDLKMPY
jgi:hypothetical protein